MKHLLAAFLLVAVTASAQVKISTKAIPASVPVPGSGPLKTGDKAPPLTITHWIQHVPDNRKLQGKLLVVDFWATWCAPCLASVPHMNKLAATFKGEPSLQFIAMSDENESRIRALLPHVPFSSIVVSDTTRKTFDAFGIVTIPYCALIDDKQTIKWAGNPKDLTEDMLKQFIQKKTIAYTPQPENSDETFKKFYDSLKVVYNTRWDDTATKEEFILSPLMNEGDGMQVTRSAGDALQEKITGRLLKDALARLLDVSTARIELPNTMTNTYVSYYYKSAIKGKPAAIADTIIQQLGLRQKMVDSLQDVMILEVNDTTKLYADLPDPNDRISRTSSSDDVISLKNAAVTALIPNLQSIFKCTVIIKNADQYKRKINMTVMTGKLNSSLGGYGISVTPQKQNIPKYIFY